MNLIFDFITDPYSSYSTTDIILEGIAVFMGLSSVWFAKQNKVWVYPTGMISTAIYVYLLLKSGLLGDFLINAYYFIMSIYGWIFWTQQKEGIVLHQIDTINLQDKIFGIECNFEELNGIDFRKGCYVGQENTARIKLKDKLNKRLFAIKVQEGEISSDEITYENKNIGKLLINNKNPFALLKLENKKFNFDIDLRCGDAKIKVLRPNWI